MYGGYAEGLGPRYCPSIEDKIVKFADVKRCLNSQRYGKNFCRGLRALC